MYRLFYVLPENNNLALYNVIYVNMKYKLTKTYYQ